MLVFVVLVANQLPNFRPHCAGALRISSHVAHDLPESARVPLALNSCPKLLSKMECGNAFVTPALETLYLAGFVLEIEEKEFHGADLRKDSIILPSPKLYRGCSATAISVLVEKLVFQPIRELCEQKRTVVGVGIGQKAQLFYQ